MHLCIQEKRSDEEPNSIEYSYAFKDNKLIELRCVLKKKLVKKIGCCCKSIPFSALLQNDNS